jgi:hypothetical protein
MNIFFDRGKGRDTSSLSFFVSFTRSTLIALMPVPEGYGRR